MTGDDLREAELAWARLPLAEKIAQTTVQPVEPDGRCEWIAAHIDRAARVDELNTWVRLFLADPPERTYGAHQVAGMLAYAARQLENKER